jgi:hypothetical protein
MVREVRTPRYSFCCYAPVDYRHEKMYRKAIIAQWTAVAEPTIKKGASFMNKTKSGSKEVKAKTPEGRDWRSEMLARIRMLIQQADPEVIEEVKWRKPSNAMAGVPVWSHGGIICTGETYTKVVKMTFVKGALLPDLSGLFNSSLEGNIRRAIDFHEGDKIDDKALKALIRAAVALNTSEQEPPVHAPKRSKASRK